MAAGGAARAGTPMKRALLLALLALAAGLYAWYMAPHGNAPAATAGNSASDDSSSGYVARNVELVETGEDGQTRYRLLADGVEQQSLSGPLLLRAPRISFSGTTGSGHAGDDLDWQLRATAGTLAPKHDEVEFSGDVQGQAGRGGAPLLRLSTTELAVNTVQQVIRSSKDVELDWAGIHLVAGGIRIELRTGAVRIGPGHGFQTP